MTMMNIAGNWFGRITGTNNGNIFAEIMQNNSNLSGVVRINDPLHGTSVYKFVGEPQSDIIILNMKPDPDFFNKPITQNVVIKNQKLSITLPADAGHGNVTVKARLVKSGKIEGTWSSTIGTGGNVFIYNEQNVSKRQPKITENGVLKSIFVSYCHEDKKHLKRLQVHMRPLEKEGLVDLWDDTKIKVGEKWKEEIANALSKAAIAILVISADFLASDFIVDNELPPILEKAELDGTRIVPIILKPCRFSRDKNLSKFQALNSPDKPLLSMSEVEQEELWDRLCHLIEEELKI